MKILCSENPPALRDSEGIAFAMYSSPTSREIGRIGLTIPNDLRRHGFDVDPVSWDFLTIALAVIAADHGCLRRGSADGWTRQIELCVSVQVRSTWEPLASDLEVALGFLTGDIWKIEFDDGGPAPPILAKRKRGQNKLSGDVVCLFSGGMDSLVGAIDLIDEGMNPILVSQRAFGDSDRQCEFAARIASSTRHLQLSHAVYSPGKAERSQRARSIIFLAYGLLAASALRGSTQLSPVSLIVPENGFISMNVPLTNLRIGTLSTRTTHPFFLNKIQDIWAKAGLNVNIQNPYQFQTKGELLVGCRRQDLLQELASKSTSCGRFRRYGYKHCGRCIPCLIRRSAFLKWGQHDGTEYVFDNLQSQSNFDDVRSLAMACMNVKKTSIDRWAAGSISYMELGDPTPYMETVRRGIEEVRTLLRASGVL